MGIPKHTSREVGEMEVNKSVTNFERRKLEKNTDREPATPDKECY
jgi:hypothetical protein